MRRYGDRIWGTGVEPGTTIDRGYKDQQNGLKIKLLPEKAQEELSKIEARKCLTAKKQMNDINHSIISKEGYSRYDYINKVTNMGFKLAFENHSTKDISGLKA
ncbi:hypothetical protein ACKUZO_021650 [Acinetobacter baumannii]